jgi:hypothetical protein
MSTHEVRVYADGRLCITAPILKKYAAACGIKTMPKAIWISEITKDRGQIVSWVRLTWKKPSKIATKKHDLSVRERVLFGSYDAGELFEATVSKKGIFIDLGRRNAKVLTKEAAPKKPKKRKSRFTSKWQTRFEKSVRKHILDEIRENHKDATLEELVAVTQEKFPGITVGEIIGDD